MTNHTDGRSLGQLFSDLSRETRTLIQQEIYLAKVELGEKVSLAGKGAAFIVGGGLLAYGGVLALVAALVLGLIAAGLPAWLGALIAGLVVIASGYLLVRSGLDSIRPQRLTPRQTLESLKEDAQWIKSQAG